MPGALMQLVAYGPQDVYLKGNPQMTFWKAVYKRHTNFAIEKHSKHIVDLYSVKNAIIRATPN